MSLTYRVSPVFENTDLLGLSIDGLLFDIVPVREIVELMQRARYEFGPPLPPFPHREDRCEDRCEECGASLCHIVGGSVKATLCPSCNCDELAYLMEDSE